MLANGEEELPSLSSSKGGRVLAVLLGIVVIDMSWSAQAQTSFNPTAAGAASPLPIESEMIAYEAIGELARELGRVIKCGYPLREVFNQARDASSKEVRAAGGSFGGCSTSDAAKVTAAADRFLLATPPNIAAVNAYETFLAVAAQLKEAYNKAMTTTTASGGTFGSRVLTGTAAIAGAEALSTAISAVRTQTAQSNSTFTPVDQALYSDLEREIWAVKKDLVVTPYPDQYVLGNVSLTTTISEVIVARQKAIEFLVENSSHKGPAYDPLSFELKDFEAPYQTFQSLVSGAGGSSITLGAALAASLGKNYDVITLANTAAGGGQRANTYFLLNVFLPAPHLSFNGGAVVSYTIRGSDGVFKTSGMLRLVFGYTKWKEKPLRDKRNEGYANFNWSPSYNNAHWVPIY